MRGPPRHVESAKSVTVTPACACPKVERPVKIQPEGRREDAAQDPIKYKPEGCPDSKRLFDEPVLLENIRESITKTFQ